MINIFHDRLKEVLKKQKISQSELARTLNVKHSSVWEWCNTSYPSIERLIEICGTLKVSPNYLLGFDE